MSIAEFNIEQEDSLNTQALNELTTEMKLARETIENEFYYRREFINKLQHPERDLDKDCGYVETNKLTCHTFAALYERFPIASRIIDLPVDESWRNQPTVFENQDEDEETEFEKAWKILDKELRGEEEESWYQDEAGSPIFEHLQRADRLSRIGHYGVIFLELDDVGKEGKDGKIITWNDPAPNFEEHASVKSEYTTNEDKVDKKKTKQPKTSLIGIRCFDETHASIAEWETDPLSRRYGKPKRYNISTGNSDGTGGRQVTDTESERQVSVHWSRVVHVTDKLTNSEYMSIPAMLPVANDLLDLTKIFGASGEGYWRMAFPTISFETHPNLGAKSNLDLTKTKEQIQRVQDTLQRWIATTGGTIKTVSGSVQDPGPHIEPRIEAICIYLGCPVRIFKGSERGQLASTQDKDSWDERMVMRQVSHITPRIIVPFVDRLIKVGVLPKPKGFSVDWGDLTSLSKAAKLAAAVSFVDAVVKYISGGADTLISPMFFLTKILEFTQDEAEEILDAAEEHVAEKAEEQAADQELQQETQMKQQKDMIDAGLAPPPVAPGAPGKPPVPGQPPGAPPVAEKPTGQAPKAPTPEPLDLKGKPKILRSGKDQFTKNSFCPTGEGGGRKFDCGGEKGSGAAKSSTSKSTKDSSGEDKPKYEVATASDKIAAKYAPQMVHQGNLDLNDRPRVKNVDGSISTVRSMSIEVDGMTFLLPTVIGDKVVSDDEAVDHFKKSGEHLGAFKDNATADKYAEDLHLAQEADYTEGGSEGESKDKPVSKSAGKSESKPKTSTEEKKEPPKKDSARTAKLKEKAKESGATGSRVARLKEKAKESGATGSRVARLKEVHEAKKKPNAKALAAKESKDSKKKAYDDLKASRKRT